MLERDGAERVANKSGCTSDWLTYCKLRNYVTKLNKKKKILHYEAKINDRKKLEYLLAVIIVRKTNSTPSFI